RIMRQVIEPGPATIATKECKRIPDAAHCKDNAWNVQDNLLFRNFPHRMSATRDGNGPYRPT
ncbi:MAG: hypothetical protein AAF745_16045, partial [Planctomycetota bacterium]